MRSPFRILAVLASPRRGGNSEVLLNACLEEAVKMGAHVDTFFLNSMKFVPCQECPDITGDGRCKLKDEMQKIYPLMEQADAVILASPIFFGSVSAQAKMMIDRFQCQWLGIYMLKTYKNNKRKQGVFISVEGSDRKDFFENARSVVKNFFATVGASYKYELFCPGVDEKGAVQKHPECIKKARDIGRLLVENSREAG